MVKFVKTLALVVKFVRFAGSIVKCVRNKRTSSDKNDYQKVALAATELATIVSDKENINTAKEVGNELLSLVDKMKLRK